MAKKLHFCAEPPRKTGKRTIRTNHAVTRNHDGDGVFAIGCPHGAAGFGVADGGGDGEVARRFPKGNVSECLPNLLLKGRARRGDSKLELPPLTRKVFFELLTGLAMNRGQPLVAHARQLGLGGATKADGQ